MTYLLDTNVLIYAVDDEEPVRQEQARALLYELAKAGQAVVSAQVLAEFANVTVNRLPSHLSLDELYRQVERYERSLHVIPLTPSVVLEAVRGVRDHQLSYYDAQIWAAARLNQVPYILSEDFNAGATLDGVTFLNPFVRGFDVDDLLG